MAIGFDWMQVRFANPQLKSMAYGKGSIDHVPDAVAREIQMIVFWLDQTIEEMDLAAFPRLRDEGGNEAFRLAEGYCLNFDIKEDQITFTDLLCKGGTYER